MTWAASDLLAGKYRLIRRLGEGSAAQAWEAENVLLGRTVAVKILHSHLAKDAATRGRFLAEARAAARIAHPHVVDVYDIGVTDDGTPFIVMELCNGETLSSVIDGRGAMGASYAVDLLSQVLVALHAAHELGIVHRDLKPDNIMLVHPRPDQPVVKVLDFGIALGVFGDSVPADERGFVFGTPEYMPPEQARGETVDARADLYAAGAILYELLTGAPPFVADTPTETLARMLTRPAVPPSRIVTTIPKELDVLVLAALSKLPARRPQTARDFLHRLLPFTSSGQIPSVLPPVDSEAPLPLVTGRPIPAPTGTKPLAREGRVPPSRRTGQRLELVVDSNPPPIHPLLHRK